MTQMASAMILAAGLGTRLKPLTDILPKPLVPVGDRPMLAHVIERVRSGGCAPIVVNAHHHAGVLARVCAELGATVSREDDDLLGTAGGLARGRSLLGGGDVLVHNGDVLASAKLTELLEAHRTTGSAATLLVVPRAAGEGNVGFDERGHVVRLRKETFAPGESSGGEFTGIHVVSERVALPERGCMVGDVYMPRLRGKISDLCVYSASEFVDVGSPAGYLAANLAWLASQNIESFIGDDVLIDPRVTVDHCVIGSGARIEGEGVVARCVVWPGAKAVAPIADAVVTGR
jgi:mannose-1-phosphate guanylyltransferase